MKNYITKEEAMMDNEIYFNIKLIKEGDKITITKGSDYKPLPLVKSLPYDKIYNLQVNLPIPLDLCKKD